MKISVLNSGFSKTSKEIDIQELFDNILGDKNNLSQIKNNKTTYNIKSVVLAIRALDRNNFESDKEYTDAKNQLKIKLSCFTPSVILQEQVENNDELLKNKTNYAIHYEKYIVSYTNLFHLDFDELTNEKRIELEKLLKKDKDVYFYFKSPSMGIKCFIKTSIEGDVTDIPYQKIYHQYLFEYFNDKYNKLGFKIDIACKNINRLCFLSYDPDLYVNSDSTIFSFNKHDLDKIKSGIKKQIINYKKEEIVKTGGDLVLYEVLDWLESKHDKFINEANKDDTDHYSNWMPRAFSFINYFNKDIEKARLHFEKLAKYSIRYTEEQLLEYFDKQWSKNYKSEKSPTITYFFRQMKDIGFLFQDSKNYRFFNYSKNDIGYILDKEKIFFKVDKITSDYILVINDEEGQPTEERINTVVNIVCSYIPNALKNKVLEVLTDSRKIIYTNDLLDTLNKHKTKDSKDFDDFIEAVDVKIINDLDDAFPILLCDWIFGCFDNLFSYDYYKFILIFKGQSNIGKTYIANKLISPFKKYVNQNFDWNISNKDNLEILCKSPFILDDELQAVTKADIHNIKNMTSKTEVDYRDPYGKMKTRKKRISSFIGTTNLDIFFKDDTRANRFLSFEIQEVDRLLLNKINFEKLWGYMWEMYSSKTTDGISYRDKITENRNDLIGKINEDSRLVSNEEEYIKENFIISTKYTFKLTDILRMLEVSINSKITLSNLASILKSIGYSKIRKADNSYWNIMEKNKNFFEEMTEEDIDKKLGESLTYEEIDELLDQKMKLMKK